MLLLREEKMMKTVARNRFIDACEKLLNDKPNKKGR